MPSAGWSLGAWADLGVASAPAPATLLSGDESTLHLMAITRAPGTAATLDTLDVIFTFRSN